MLDRCRHDSEIVGARARRLPARARRRPLDGARGGRVHRDHLLSPAAAPQGGRRWCRRSCGPRSSRQPALRRSPGRLLERRRRSARGPAVAARLRCLVYGMRGGPDEVLVEGNLEFRPRSTEGFVEALRTARGVVAGGGFSLLSEAVYLGKPVLSIPLSGQFEQLMNARYLERLGYGMCATALTAERIGSFVSRIGEFEGALSDYRQSGTRSRSRRSRIAPSRPRAALPASCATRAAKRGGPPDEAWRARRDRRRGGRRRVRMVPWPVPDLAALRPNDLPWPRRGANDRADLRRRPESAPHRGPDGGP